MAVCLILVGGLILNIMCLLFLVGRIQDWQTAFPLYIVKFINNDQEQ